MLKIFVASLVIHGIIIASAFISWNSSDSKNNQSLSFQKSQVSFELVPEVKTSHSLKAKKSFAEKSKSENKAAQNSSDLPNGVISGIQVEYPELAKSRGEEGEVLLGLSFRKAKHSITIAILKSSGSRLLDKSAVRAIETASINFDKMDDNSSVEEVEHQVLIKYKLDKITK